jgi:hypothetical protein
MADSSSARIFTAQVQSRAMPSRNHHTESLPGQGADPGRGGGHERTIFALDTRIRVGTEHEDIVQFFLCDRRRPFHEAPALDSA